MPETIEITAYSIDELEGKAREKALDWARYAGFNNDMIIEDTRELFRQRLEELGYPTDQIEWSLGHCQGDGMAFYGHVDVDKWLTAHKRRTYYRKLRDPKTGDLDVEIEISRNSFGYHYAHFNTMSVNYEYRPYSRERAIETLAKELCEEIDDDVRAVSKGLEREGYKIAESWDSDEVLSESLRMNDIRFDENGNHTISL